MEYLLAPSSDAMKYVDIYEPLRKKWEEAKEKKLKYYIANISPECWVQCKTRRPIVHIQPYLITTMVLTLLAP